MSREFFPQRIYKNLLLSRLDAMATVCLLSLNIELIVDFQKPSVSFACPHTFPPLTPRAIRPLSVLATAGTENRGRPIAPNL